MITLYNNHYVAIKCEVKAVCLASSRSLMQGQGRSLHHLHIPEALPGA